MPRKPKTKTKQCEFCGRRHRRITVRQCLLGKRGIRGVLWEKLKEAMQVRDGNRCVRCGCYCYGEHQHMSHVYRAARCGRLKYDLKNVKTMCSSCHRWWHDYEAISGIWFHESFPDRSSYLDEAFFQYRQQLGTIPMPFYRERFDELQAYIATAKEEKGL